jgi:hypothetical protein
MRQVQLVMIQAVEEGTILQGLKGNLTKKVLEGLQLFQLN